LNYVNYYVIMLNKKVTVSKTVEVNLLFRFLFVKHPKPPAPKPKEFTFRYLYKYILQVSIFYSENF
jgi:hypothetical protein